MLFLGEWGRRTDDTDTVHLLELIQNPDQWDIVVSLESRRC